MTESSIPFIGPLEAAETYSGAPSEILPHLISVLGAASLSNKTVAELDPYTREALTLFGYYGTHPDNVPDPGSYLTHRRRNAQQRELGKLITDGNLAMQHAAAYKQAGKEGTVGLTVTGVYTGVRSVRRHGVYVDRPIYKAGEVVDGRVTAQETGYVARDGDTLTMLHEFFQAMHAKTPQEHFIHPISASCNWQPTTSPWDHTWAARTWRPTPGEALTQDDEKLRGPWPDMLYVTELSEYQRIATEAIRLMVAEELRQVNIVLSDDKVPSKILLLGRTVPREIRDWWRAKKKTYMRMHEAGFVSMSPADSPDDEAKYRPEPKKNVAATEPAPVFRAERDSWNTFMRQLRGRGGDSSNNQEQDPDRSARYPFEKRTNVRRRRPRPGQKYQGPETAVPLTLVERALLEMQDTWREVRQRPGRRIPNLLIDVVGKLTADMLDIGLSATKLAGKGLVGLGKGVKHHAQDYKTWQQQRGTARTRVRVLRGELADLYAAIQSGEKPDQFPDTRLPDSPQLRLIRGMTATMLADLGYTPEDIAHSGTGSKIVGFAQA